jgi:hypothetical protein
MVTHHMKEELPGMTEPIAPIVADDEPEDLSWLASLDAPEDDDPILSTALEAAVAAQRARFPRLPSWQVDGRHLIARIGDDIVEDIDLSSMGKPRFPEPLRGVLADRVVVQTDLDPYLTLKALAEYSGFARRTLLSFLTGQNIVPHYRIGNGKVVVRRSAWDAWINQFHHTKSRMEALLDERRDIRSARRSLAR